MSRIRLGELQLAVMQVLWEVGKASVADVRARLAPERELATTTVATVLARLERQEAVGRRSEEGVYAYFPLVTEREVRRSMVGDLVERLFHGDPDALVHHLLREEEVDPDELERLREAAEREEGGG